MSRATSRPTSAQAFDTQWRAFHEKNAATEQVPPGAITIAGYAELNGLSRASADCVLKGRMRCGLLKTAIFRVYAGGRCRQVRYYWPAK